jgi:superfamily II DNA or RNA helicase
MTDDSTHTLIDPPDQEAPRPGPVLRPYQVEDHKALRAARAAGHQCICYVAVTGSGKTVTCTALQLFAKGRGKRSILISHRREITKQTVAKLEDLGITAGIIQAGFPLCLEMEVQVASIQTLYARAIRGNGMELPPVDLVLLDECHHAPAPTYRKVIDHYLATGATIIGMTATP